MIKVASDDLHNRKQRSPLRVLEAMAVGPIEEIDKRNVLEWNVKVYICTERGAEAESFKSSFRLAFCR